jgi:hypothetical protein
MKIKEPRRILALFILTYIVFASLIITENFRQKLHSPEQITGHSANGVVQIKLEGELPPGSAEVPREKKEEEPTAEEAPSEPVSEAPVAAVLPAIIQAGAFDTEGILQFELGIGDTAEFMYNGEMHAITLTEANSEGVSILLASEPVNYFLPFYGSTGVDPDFDGVIELMATVTKNGREKFLITLAQIKQPMIQLPSGIDLLKNQIAKLKHTGWTLASIALLLIIASLIGYQRYVAREIKVDRTLTSYIKSAMEKGFIEPQIRAKLLENGFDEEEVDFVFKHLKNSIPNKK